MAVPSSSYTVNTAPLGKKKVFYSCPSCGTELHNLLTDAGQVYPCPMCKKTITVSGMRELQAQVAENELQKTSKSQKLLEAAREKESRETAMIAKTSANARQMPMAEVIQQTAPMSVPEYSGLVTGSRVLNFLGVLCLICGVIAVFFAFATMFGHQSDYISSTDLNLQIQLDQMQRGRAIAYAESGLSAFVIGIFNFFIASALLALRDIARNSWRID